MPWRSRWLMLDVLFTLCWFSLYVRWRSFQQLSARWQGQGMETPQDIDPAHQATAREVEWLIDAASRRLPFEATCLMQASAAKSILARRGIASTIYFGVAPSRDDGRAVNAHAWLRCGARIITGRAQARECRALTWFS